jgi:sugar (pentulose or hexulose) kinase
MVEHATSESSALGTAFFAANMMGLVSGYAAVRQWNPVVNQVAVDPEMQDRYGEAYERFLEQVRKYA